MTGKTEPPQRWGPDTGDPAQFADLGAVLGRLRRPDPATSSSSIVELYEQSEAVRAQFCPTPYLSCLVSGCAEKGLDVTQGGAELSLRHHRSRDLRHHGRFAAGGQVPGVRQEALHAWPSWCRRCKDNWAGHEVLQARALHKAPKYGRDDDAADALARQVMELWTEETWKYKTQSTGRQFRPGMLSWNYWVADGYHPARQPGRAAARASSSPTPSAPPTARTSTDRPPTSTRWARCWAARRQTARATGRTT